MEKAYAQALWKVIASGTEPAKAVRALHASLQTHGREALMPRIAVAFQRLAERENQKNSALLTVAYEKDAHPHAREIKEILNEMGVQSNSMTVAVDPTLVGGWRLEGKGRLVDASYKKYLLDMYNRAVR